MFAKRLMPLLSLRFFVVCVVLHGFDWLIERLFYVTLEYALQIKLMPCSNQ